MCAKVGAKKAGASLDEVIGLVSPSICIQSRQGVSAQVRGGTNLMS